MGGCQNIQCSAARLVVNCVNTRYDLRGNISASKRSSVWCVEGDAVLLLLLLCVVDLHAKASFVQLRMGAKTCAYCSYSPFTPQ